MAKSIPYVVSPGKIKKVFETIKKAPTPEKVNYDWVNAKASLSGGTARAIPPFLKKIGFLSSEGKPTDLYRQFRNSATAGVAMAKAIKKGYSTLYEHNEYLHDLPDKDFKGILIQATGMSEEDRSLALTLSTFKALKEFADFEGREEPRLDDDTDEYSPSAEPPHAGLTIPGGAALGLSYSINLNLPATTDVSVYNAIFKALRQHLIDD